MDHTYGAASERPDCTTSSSPPPRRRAGVGTALFRSVREWAATRHVKCLQWQSTEDALPFYRSLGLNGDPCPDPAHPFFEIKFEEGTRP